MKTGKKISGGRYHQQRKKKQYEKPGNPRVVKLSETDKKKKIRTIGGHFKTVMLVAKTVSVTNKKTKKTKKVQILNVIETPNNKFLARQNIISKGTIIETELGKARVTNRPSQNGSVQAVLIN